MMSGRGGVGGGQGGGGSDAGSEEAVAHARSMPDAAGATAPGMIIYAPMVIITGLPRRTRADLPGGDWVAIDAIPSGLPAVGVRVHEAFGAILVLAGTGTFQDRAGAVHPIAPGTMFLHLPGVPHLIQRHGAGRWRQLVLRLSPGAWEALRTFGVLPGRQVFTAAATAGPALIALQRVLADHRTPPGGLLASLAETCQALVPAAASDEPLAESARLLAQDHAARLDLRALAGRCGWSYSHFRRAFRLRHGLAPAAWRRRHRLDEARRQRRAGATLAAAARHLGWRNPAALGRLLRRK